MSNWLMATGRPVSLPAAFLGAVVFGLLLAPPAQAELRISNLSVFLNDFDVTVHVVLFGAISPSLYESVQTGIAAHARVQVEVWQYNRFSPDRKLLNRTVERQIAYNVLTKEYKVISLKGEQRETYLTKDLREAQRVISEFRIGHLAPASSLNPRELYYVRVQSDVSLGGVNSWIARMSGDAEETEWMRSSLLTVSRGQ